MLLLYTLGETRLESETGQILSRRRKPLVLLAYLARHAPRPVARVELAALLWGERAEAKARQSLRQALVELKRLTGPALHVSQETARLDSGTVAMDVVDFERDVDAGRDAAAIGRWHGDFLADADDAGELALRLWAETERAALRRRLTLAFERLLAEAERRGAWRDVVALARRWIETSPLEERAWTALIGGLRLEGHVADALASHTSYVTRLREALDVEPSPAFMAMAHSLDYSARATPSGDDRSLAEVHTAEGLPFVGRDEAFSILTSAWRAVRDGESRTVMIEGAPGMGATRLCDELMRWIDSSDTPALVLRTDLSTTPRDPEPSPFSGTRALLEELRQAPALGGVSADALAVLAHVVPGLRERFPRIDVPAAPPHPSAVTDAVRESLQALAEDASVLVIVEGTSAADAETRALLLNLARTMHARALFVFADSADRAGDDAMQALGTMAATRAVRLAPLSPDHIERMLDAVAGLDDDERGRLAAALHEETGGVPGYVAPVVEMLADQRQLAGSGAAAGVRTAVLAGGLPPVPNRVVKLVQRRVRSLSSDARRVLDAVAVFGAPIERRGAEQLTGLEPARARAALDELERAQLMRPGPELQDFELFPPIVSRAAYANVPVLQRELLHTAAARLHEERLRPWHRRSPERARAVYHRQRSGGTASGILGRSRWRIGAAIAAALVLLTIGALLARRTPRYVRARMVAVFPFAVRGDASFAFLRTGLVDLLTTSLDGAAGLHTIDARAVLAATDTSAGARELSPERAREIATRLGASYFVLGTVVGAPGQLNLSATMYATREPPVATARASAGGDENALFSLVDRVTAQFAIAQGGSSDERLTRLAAVTTASLDALKAYLEGRSAYLSSDSPAALAAFQRAVTADSSFALAWYGMANAASWMLLTATEQRAAAQAVRNAGRLSERDRMLVTAFAAYSRGAADTAEQLASSVVNAYDDIEASELLAETQYHHNWKRGHSLVESRHAWERVLASDSNYWPALQHLSEVAVIEGKPREADSLLARYERSVGVTHMLMPSRALRAFAYGDQAARDTITSELAGDRGFWLISSLWYVAVFAQDMDGARLLTRFLVEPVRPPEQQALGRILLAHLALTQGKWREARAELAIARAHTPADAIEYQLLLSMAPFLSTPSAELLRERAELDELTLPTAPVSSATLRWADTDGILHPMIRAYLDGLVSARAGDEAGAEHALADLSRLPDPTASTMLGRGFAFSIRAEQLRGRRQPSAALLDLERSERATSFVPAWTSAFVSQAYERYERAELLREQGRDDEALQWYGTFAENSPYDLVYLAPSMYRRAQILERRGRSADAARDYARFIALWKDCDPELRPLVADAAARLAQLARAQVTPGTAHR